MDCSHLWLRRHVFCLKRTTLASKSCAQKKHKFTNSQRGGIVSSRCKNKLPTLQIFELLVSATMNRFQTKRRERPCQPQVLCEHQAQGFTKVALSENKPPYQRRLELETCLKPNPARPKPDWMKWGWCWCVVFCCKLWQTVPAFLWFSPRQNVTTVGMRQYFAKL